MLLIILGASAWGTLGIFAVSLYGSGLRPIDVAAARVTVAWACFAAMAPIANRGRERLTARGLGWLVAHGLIAVALYNLLYFGAIAEVGIALAVALLYSAPVWSAVLGYLALGERHAARVYMAVPLAVIGVALVITKPAGLGLDIPLDGLLLGLGAALAYALFSILGKPLLRAHPPSTVLFFSFGSGGIVLNIVAWLDGGWERLLSLPPTMWLLVLAVGIFPTFLAYLVYTQGLRHTPASLATVLASIEPVVAVTLGTAVVGEPLSVRQLGGIVLVILSATAAARWQTGESRTSPLSTGRSHIGKPNV